MDTQMKIDGERVRRLREGRSWSQEHLASASGLSVRTVQRVESEGIGSAETRLSLAAALEVPVATLMPEALPSAKAQGMAIPAGAWLGWGAGAAASLGAVALNYFAGHVDNAGAARDVGVVSALLGATWGLMSALSGVLRNRGPAA